MEVEKRRFLCPLKPTADWGTCLASLPSLGFVMSLQGLESPNLRHGLFGVRIHSVSVNQDECQEWKLVGDTV